MPRSSAATAKPTARRFGRFGATLALSALATLSGALPAVTGSAAAKARVGVALPAGWEMCVLRGVNAPLTAANVVDLDVWQVAEGGSTNNDVAYNPFNTRRGTDVNDAALPATYDASGFPMFADWPSGCAATAATILQPNMAPVAEALTAGNVSPPGAFLAVVDQTPWCAPSNGVPCYSDAIAGQSAVTTSSAIGLYHDTAGAVAAYDRDATAQGLLAQKLDGARQQVAQTSLEVAFAQLAADHAGAVLRKVAVYDYTSNPTLDHMASLLGQFSAPNDTALLSQYYQGLDVTAQVARMGKARAELASAQSARTAALTAGDDLSRQLNAARGATQRALARVDVELVALQAAGVCTAPPPTPTPTPAGAPATTAPTAASPATAGDPGSGPASVATVRSCLDTLAA